MTGVHSLGPVLPAVLLTLTAFPKLRWPPRKPPNISTPKPASPRAFPMVRLPEARATAEEENRHSADPLATAWTSPTRREFPCVSDQSLRPAAAVGTAVAIPTATRMSAAGSEAGPPTVSRTVAMVQAPMGKSVRTGCSGWPSDVPLRVLRTGRGCTAFPTALEMAEATPSSRSKCSMASTNACNGFTADSLGLAVRTGGAPKCASPWTR